MVPAILAFCIVGSYAVDYSFFDVLVMLLFSMIGFFMQRYGYPCAPMILGVILGKMLETYFVMTYMKGGVIAFFNRPISLIIVGLIVLVVIAPSISKRLLRKS